MSDDQEFLRRRGLLLDGGGVFNNPPRANDFANLKVWHSALDFNSVGFGVDPLLATLDGKANNNQYEQLTPADQPTYERDESDGLPGIVFPGSVATQIQLNSPIVNTDFLHKGPATSFFIMKTDSSGTFGFFHETEPGGGGTTGYFMETITQGGNTRIFVSIQAAGLTVAQVNASTVKFGPDIKAIGCVRFEYQRAGGDDLVINVNDVISDSTNSSNAPDPGNSTIKLAITGQSGKRNVMYENAHYDRFFSDEEVKYWVQGARARWKNIP